MTAASKSCISFAVLMCGKARWMRAPSVSVPPVVALPKNTKPSPAPISAPPTIVVRKRSSPIRAYSGTTRSQREKMIDAAKVRRMNFHPRT